MTHHTHALTYALLVPAAGRAVSLSPVHVPTTVVHVPALHVALTEPAAPYLHARRQGRGQKSTLAKWQPRTAWYNRSFLKLQSAARLHDLYIPAHAVLTHYMLGECLLTVTLT